MKLNINQLLEKYWNAEANLQEEAQLRAYFSSDDVAPEHDQYKDLFSFFSLSRLQSTDLDVEKVLTEIFDIDAVLEKYWNAETSLEEEAQLRDYFNSDEVSDGHKSYKDLFTFYDVSRAQSSNIDINQVLSDDLSIDSILEKYWNAEASIEEEYILKQYFASGEVAASHKAYEGMFGAFTAKSLETTNLDVGEILMKAESESGNRAIGTTVMPQEAKAKVFSLQRWAAGIAAIFVLGFAAVTVLDTSESSTTQYKGLTTVLDEEAEAQEAYEITKEALAFLSKNMKTGSETVVKSVAKAEKASIFK